MERNGIIVLKKRVKIVPKSLIAQLAAKVLKANCVALVVGKRIYLHNVSIPNFLKNKSWVCHELAHVKQYEQLGLVKFLAIYFYESITKGYSNNKFEVEARNNEGNVSLLLEYFIE
jgi:hypothetical protein